MILPTKHLSIDRSLLGVGSVILGLLDKPKSASELWNTLKRSEQAQLRTMEYDWFVLALDFLFCLGSIEAIGSRIGRTGGSSRRDS